MLRRNKNDGRDNSIYNAPSYDKKNDHELKEKSNDIHKNTGNNMVKQDSVDSNNYPPRRNKSLKKKKNRTLKSQVSIEPIANNSSNNNYISGTRPMTIDNKQKDKSTDNDKTNINKSNDGQRISPIVKITVPGTVNDQDSELTDLDEGGGVEVDDSIIIQKNESPPLVNNLNSSNSINENLKKEELSNNDKSTDKHNGTIQPDKILQNKNNDDKEVSEEVPGGEQKPPEPPKPSYYKKFKEFLKVFVADKTSDWYYYWTGIVSIAFMYNLIVIIARVVFVDLNSGFMWIVWLSSDLISDIIYMIDIFVKSRTGFLEQGLLVKDTKKIWIAYKNSTSAKLDILCIIPLDYIFTYIIFDKPIARFNRLIKVERIKSFMETTETRSSMPNVFRVFTVVCYIIVIIHWNACFYFAISELIGLGSDSWVYGPLNTQSLPEGVEDTLIRRYIYSFYWSTLILTTIGEVPGPVQNIEFVFVTFDLMGGVLIFATIVGNVGSMISNMSADRTEFQNKMDSIKQYMELRKVSKALENRVIKWFDYLWANKQNLSDQQVLKLLPDKLQAEIAMHVHFETLRKVRIFQDCEAGLLAELVLKLQLQVFSPGDYICRKGDIGREMYIVKRGKLQVVADDGVKVFATLQEGSVFGELSILNIAGSKNGNRRTANVRSVGYTDLFVLNKQDLWNALKEYPEARKMLIAKGREILKKDNLLDENAPEEQNTVEEIAEELQNSVKVLQTRLARLTAEYTNTENKLRNRIEYLEKRLRKYQVISDIRNEDYMDTESIRHSLLSQEKARQDALDYKPKDKNV
ncbi:Cyclic nucleotide-binding domain and Potassium channel, voltage-dependent, EAG/ELK/ERG family and RmlC-like jelly roll fold domain and Cyclic nucleotide-binding-like domain-containing protein [Strongyloides ratti]|uniref:Cyclic nucleotide-binding domain and Potassium channel, voltage-dependent, EAG/ELK/ERG family and RmlC-like jelly roll fold domain and Cyclic nucleotide-binding-like domain-containing protein n=1 Tax=Strongyloides ratti TaxID=34506 RepID=A0A090MYS2_STRRB|nr:Cyclic nucleotide-binding domain and Potassium channel, voltage-dependent, EAG/ELK/ERG family and RmlC-like jelly roll fold domain and Cyclic nucleotide-binding-like domain-containing protein [Strongyloides ratti]CEF67679.1 Cyclic nucleotide-binding domain and Potassium channel, voltage-dependent, EAG/ELK/ERG family and RmlC-like jelly roll fold domain and Cyclic nucleotide-binding-like domain-containing protein [Strongyloides ratti]